MSEIRTLSGPLEVVESSVFPGESGSPFACIPVLHQNAPASYGVGGWVLSAV